MIKKIAPLCIALVLAGTCGAQSIRKNFTEMTQEEKDALVAAFHTLGDGGNSAPGAFPAVTPNLIWDIAKFHNANFGAIHQKSSEATNAFHAWHRYASFELEQAMQNLYPNLSIPYWDWTVNNTTSDALWSSTFLGQFQTSWTLGRVLGSGTLPTASQVQTAQAMVSWWPSSNASSYAYQVENTALHNNAHNWVGGTMVRGTSPRDPVFWLHHNMIDKLWQNWEDQEPAFKTFHTRTNLPRYDGTYRPYPFGTTPLLPSIDPDNIRDSRSLGVFYAGNQLAVLDQYTVANRTRTPESFVYKYAIRAGNNFVVPAGKSCAFKSQTSVEWTPGFTVDGGSVTVDITSGSILSKVSAEEQEMRAIEGFETSLKDESMRHFLGSGGMEWVLDYKVPLWGSETADVSFTDIRGREMRMDAVRTESVSGYRRMHFNTERLSPGVYYARIRIGNKVHSGKVLIGKPD